MNYCLHIAQHHIYALLNNALLLGMLWNSEFRKLQYVSVKASFLK